jgi:Sap, sulfolipid-1-addressing protein
MLLDLFLIGLVVTIEPLPLSAMILLLAADRGILKGAGFILGWLGTLVAIVALTILVTGGKPLLPQSAPSVAALTVKLLCGVALVFIGYRRWGRQRAGGGTAPKDKKQPRWMAGIDRVSPLASAGLAFLLQPWVMVAAGVSTIMQAKLSSGLEYFAVFAFCLWCTASYFTLEIYALIRPETVKSKLNALLQWINGHTDQAIVILSLGLGLYLMAKSIYGLVTAG